MRECEVCGETKECRWCDWCSAWICDECFPNLPARGLAALRRAFRRER